jgi:hypothetical protein
MVSGYTLINGLRMSSERKTPTLINFLTNWFGDIHLKPEQKNAFNILIHHVLMIPVLVLLSINDTVQRTLKNILRIPMSIANQIGMIVNSLGSTISSLRFIFSRLTRLGFGIQKVKAMTIDIFATILTNLINTKIGGFDAYVDKVTNRGIQVAMDGVKAVPFVGTVASTGTAIHTTADTVEETLETVSSNMKSIETSLDTEGSKLEKAEQKQLFKDQLTEKMKDDDPKGGYSRRRRRRRRRSLKLSRVFV